MWTQRRGSTTSRPIARKLAQSQCEYSQCEPTQCENTQCERRSSQCEPTQWEPSHCELSTNQRNHRKNTGFNVLRAPLKSFTSKPKFADDTVQSLKTKAQVKKECLTKPPRPFTRGAGLTARRDEKSSC